MTDIRLGIDVGGTKIALAFGTPGGRLLGRDRFPTLRLGSAEADLAEIARRARSLAEKSGVAWADVAAAGLSVPGPIDAESGRILRPPNLVGWDGAPVRSLLAAELALPVGRVGIENDANAAALAEWHFGAGRGHRGLVYLTMSTGLGGGLILGGRLHRGVASSAGEVGHMPIAWPGERCACGLHGCAEAYVGGAAWTRRLATVTPAGSAVAKLAGGAAHARPEHVVAAAREGDAFALEEMERFNELVSRVIVSLTMALAPECFVLGTIAVAADELFFPPVRAKVAERVWPFLSEALEIVPAALGEELPYRAGLAVAVNAES